MATTRRHRRCRCVDGEEEEVGAQLLLEHHVVAAARLSQSGHFL